MFPIHGRPLGPGGYGSLDLLRESRDLKYLVSTTREIAAPRGTAKWENILVSSSMMQRAGQERELGGLTLLRSCLCIGNVCSELIRAFPGPDPLGLSVRRCEETWPLG